MRDEPEEPGSDTSAEAGPPPAFEPPHSNGAVHQSEPARRHAPWEFLILTLLVAILCIGIVIGWTFVGSHSPERLDNASAAAAAAACNDAQTKLKALPNPDPRLGADRVARIRAEDVVLREMVTALRAVRPTHSTPAAALTAWSADWGRMVDARDTYANDLQKAAGTDTKVRLIYPATNAIKPITGHMDDFVRENNPHLDACFTGALQLEVVEGPRVYEKLTS